MIDSQFWTMKELAMLFGGETSHTVGKKLKELGLRTRDGKPSGRAFGDGLCSQRWTEDHGNYCWAWNKEKVTALLVEAGLTLLIVENS
jgi:hypothetical protein